MKTTMFLMVVRFQSSGQPLRYCCEAVASYQYLQEICVILQALYYKKYSSASDVWSFGALMYEIWSVGHKPYEDYANNEVCSKSKNLLI